jgi:hypothetical protein
MPDTGHRDHGPERVGIGTAERRIPPRSSRAPHANPCCAIATTPAEFHDHVLHSTNSFPLR